MKVTRYLALFLLGTVSGCGGSGSEVGPVVRNGYHAGTWDFSAGQSYYDCPPAVADFPDSIEDLPLVVTQNAKNVSVVSRDITLTGLATPIDDGFIVTYKDIFQGCRRETNYFFRGASDKHADAEYRVKIQCGGVTCEVKYHGSADFREGSAPETGNVADETTSIE